MHEAESHVQSAFVTLTYADKFLPASRSLVLDDVQKFMKRLRAAIAPVKVRFFLAGEYGEKLQRPHYHLILFGYAFPDKVLLGDTSRKLYVSAELSRLWGMGYCSIGEVTFESAAYVARYALKKIYGKGAAAHYGRRKPEFVVMSRRPGIGAKWIERFGPEVARDDEVIVRGRQCRPPRYYDKVLAAKDPARWAEIVAAREVAAEGSESVRNYPRLAVRGRVAAARAALYQRRTLEG